MTARAAASAAVPGVRARAHPAVWLQWVRHFALLLLLDLDMVDGNTRKKIHDLIQNLKILPSKHLE